MTKECMGLSPEEKKKFHELMDKAWDKMPGDLHDIMHSLFTQKKAVMEKFRQWAETNGEQELANLIGIKIAKTDCRIKKFEEE